MKIFRARPPRETAGHSGCELKKYLAHQPSFPSIVSFELRVMPPPGFSQRAMPVSASISSVLKQLRKQLGHRHDCRLPPPDLL
jgi:hypothetical protein